MTKAEQHEAAEVLRLVVDRNDLGEVEAPAWYRERLVGAMLALDPDGEAGSVAGLSPR
jgi:hypothetical protein